MERAIRIGQRQVMRDGMPLVLAEIGVNHDGDVEKATALVEAAAGATCEAVKFQLFRAELLLSKDVGLAGYQERAGEQSAAAMLGRLELDVVAMWRCVKRAQELGMAAVVTPFSVELVDQCVKMGVDAIKLASPDLVNKPLVEAAVATGLPLILSTGAAELKEVERTVGWLGELGASERSVLLHCVSSYPTPAERATLGAISALRTRFADMPVGYSDHTVETFTAALAVGCGACVLEKHLTLDRKAAGPDHAASLEPHEMAEYCALARIGLAMRGAFEKRVLDVEQEVREKSRQSVVAREPLKVGTILKREMLTVKRPGTGIPAAELECVLGKELVRDIAEDRVLTWEHLGGEK